MERLRRKSLTNITHVHAADRGYWNYKINFVVWTPHAMIIDEICFDDEFWCSMKNKFQKYYEHFLLRSFFSG